MMENESMTLRRDTLIKYLNRDSQIMFVETGTWDGRTVKMALDSGCDKIVSIETDPTLYDTAMVRFAGNDKVKLLHGESTFWLPLVCKSAECPILFWLDAHVQEHYIGGSVIVPLMEELEILSQCDNPLIKDSTIMIDDMRLVGTGYGWEHISKVGIITALLKINKDFTIVYEDSKAAKQDIMVAYPRGMYNA